MLDKLSGQMKAAGYVVLNDLEEEQKENNLWNQRKKLALAFGLVNHMIGKLCVDLQESSCVVTALLPPTLSKIAAQEITF